MWKQLLQATLKRFAINGEQRNGTEARRVNGVEKVLVLSFVFGF